MARYRGPVGKVSRRLGIGISEKGQRILNNFASLQAAPVAAVLLLIVGGGAGTLGGYEYAAARAAHSGVGVTEGPVKAASLPAVFPSASDDFPRPESRRLGAWCRRSWRLSCC